MVHIHRVDQNHGRVLGIFADMFERYTILRNIAFATLFVVLYLMIWRPVREELSQSVLLPVIGHFTSDFLPIQLTTDGKTTIIIYRTDAVEQKNVITFTGFGNAFFLLGSVYLLAFGFGWKPVGWLFLLHQAITAGSLICLLLAVSTHPAWLYPMNVLVTYITPAATGLFVLTVRRRP